ncbi:hypothetical protein Ahy_A06g027359 [Arachis hypogaea]|uniref:Aminotransferase-like plant mobile domain-containing protein n=1 Tax=Arachis hypogaea TaxID=3818 RepID=A0A445CND9_ARAHY|nr:hypothetical protein Ahy_A06g027359 [Arachis hypogaea]
MRRQQGMRLDERYVSYLQMTGLYHLARLNDRWFRIDEPLLSAFVERWHPKTHTFHMPFRECTITLQDVVYQLGLAVDGRYVNGCLTDFHIYIEGGRPAWVWFEEDEIEDEEPLIRRGQRTRVPRRCFTGSHLFR